MKLRVHHTKGEGSVSTLSLSYTVPVRPGSACMSVYDDRKNVSSLYQYFELDERSNELPATLTLEAGDRILLLNHRNLTVRHGMSFSIGLGQHEEFLFEIVSYYIAADYLKRRKKDPAFFRAFEKLFALYKASPFTKEEIERHVTSSELYGNCIEDYFRIAPEIRQTFLAGIR